MEKTIDNSLWPVVSEILDQVLEDYPSYPYRKALTNQDLRRTLIEHVLSQIPNWHPSKEEEDKPSLINSERVSISQENELHIRNIIRQEIAYLIQQRAECVSRSKPEEIDSCFTPSHWFG